MLAAHRDSVYPVHPVDSQLLDKLPDGVKVDAVRHGNPIQTIIALRDKLLGAANKSMNRSVSHTVAPTGAELSQPGTGQLAGFKEYLLDRMFAFPDPQCAWLNPALTFATKMPGTETPHVVFATGGPWTSFLVGRRLAEFWRVPFIADYRDPWTGNPYVSFGSKSLNERARQLERGICEAAARVITNTHELRERLVKDYPNIEKKSLTITNGFDPDSFAVALEGSGKPNTVKNRLELCHFGTVYGKRTPEVLLKVVVDLHKMGKVDSTKLCLKFVGAWEVAGRDCEDLAQSLEKVGMLERHPPVPYQACLQQMSKADALLVIQPDSPMQIPGKIYEYIATGRPLLLVGGEGATANLVQRHRLGLACANNAEKIRHTLLHAIEHPEALAVPDREEVNRFNYRSLTASLAKTLDELDPAWQRRRGA